MWWTAGMPYPAWPWVDSGQGVSTLTAEGVPYAQGQDVTFTVMLGSGVRYNLNPRYSIGSIAGGLNYRHVSNLYLSQAKYLDYGINVYGPMFGLNIKLGK
jgi:hypothetical protein